PINLFASDNEIFGIRVKWAMPEGAEDTAYIELYQSQSGTDQDASLLTLIPYPAAEYWHSILPAGYVNFYKARSVDRIGNVSAWTDYARGMSSTDVNAITDTILDEILDSDAMKELQENAQDSEAKLNDYANSIIQNALANDADVRIMRKENGKRKAEIKHAEVLIANETEARVQQVNQISAEFNENLNAGLTQVNEALANETEARVTSEEALSARIGENSAALDQKLDSWADVNGVGSMYTMKLGLKYNGQEYNSGMALQLTASGGSVVSQVLFIADRFAIIRNAESGAYTLPFVVQNDQVFMNNALIQDGSITNAKIGNVIQSNNYIAGEQGWIINKNGSSEFSDVTVRGTIYATDGWFKGTVYAEHIEGDVMIAESNTIPFKTYSDIDSGDYEILKIHGENFDRSIDTNLIIQVNSTFRNTFRVIVQTPGKGEIEFYSIDTGNDGGTRAYALRGFDLPAAGRGQENRIIVRVTQSGRGSSIKTFTPWVERDNGTTGQEPSGGVIYNTGFIRERAYISAYRKGNRIVV
ncbi:tail fiber protein, partial [Klebsiella phage vB_Kpn-VAC111]